jgi:NADH:ubiquinone oxidoreductase subunit 3 (subunit A)
MLLVYLNFFVVELLVFLIIAFIVSLVIFFLSYFLSGSFFCLESLSIYECGFEPFGDSRNFFDLHFYVICILFIIFDLEILYVCLIVALLLYFL